MEGSAIQIIDSFKYLRIMVDRDLKFNQYLDMTCKKNAKKLEVLNRCGSFLSLWSRKTVYNTIVLPHFHFAGTTIHLVNKSDTQRLQVLQNKAMRKIANVIDLQKQMKC